MEKLKISNVNIIKDDKLIEKMKEALFSCAPVIKYCQDIGMSNEVIEKNVTKIYDLVRDTNYCRKCPGLSKCTKDDAFLVNKITYNNNIVENQLIPCKALLKRVTFEKQIVEKDFPEEWLDISTSDVDKSETKTEVFSIYNKYLKNLNTDWIYLTGGVGSGKSYLAAALTIDLAKKQIKGKSPICFINSSRRFLELSDLKKDDNELFKQKIDLYSTVPVLIIDDFGTELKTDFIRDTIVYPIISTRCNKKLFTVFTSNFTLEEIEVLYATNNARAIMAKQIVKTIKAMCKKEINLGDLKLYK